MNNHQMSKGCQMLPQGITAGKQEQRGDSEKPLFSLPLHAHRCVSRTRLLQAWLKLQLPALCPWKCLVLWSQAHPCTAQPFPLGSWQQLVLTGYLLASPWPPASQALVPSSPEGYVQLGSSSCRCLRQAEGLTLPETLESPAPCQVLCTPYPNQFPQPQCERVLPPPLHPFYQGGGWGWRGCNLSAVTVSK